jgi:hypothetical protein
MVSLLHVLGYTAAAAALLFVTLSLGAPDPPPNLQVAGP